MTRKQTAKERATSAPRTKKAAPPEPVEGEVSDQPIPADAVTVSPDSTPTAEAVRLDAIAASIREEFGKGVEAQFAIGRLLIEARAMFPADQEYGRWLKAQQLPFTYQTAWNLRIGAEREDEVREYIALNAGGEQPRDIGVTTAVKDLTRKTEAVGKVPAEAQKRVKDLLDDDETVKNGFPAYRAAVAGLDLSQLPDEELAEFAVLTQGLIEAYKAEKARR